MTRTVGQEGAFMDSASLTLLAIASTGAIYYVLYRVVFHQKLKWKMIHSIWLPIAVALFGIVITAGLLMHRSLADRWPIWRLL